METRFAKIVSYLFHPIFLPFYCLLLLFYLQPYFTFQLVLNARILLMFFVFGTTIVFPLLITFLMLRQGYIQSIYMDTRQERKYPYLITAVFYILTFNMFRQLHLPDIYLIYMMGASILLILIVIINFWWKISTHMVGIGGLFGFFTGFTFYLSLQIIPLILIVVLLAGLIGYARLKLNSHKPAEVYTGFLMGTVVMLAMFYLI